MLARTPVVFLVGLLGRWETSIWGRLVHGHESSRHTQLLARRRVRTPTITRRLNKEQEQSNVPEREVRFDCYYSRFKHLPSSLWNTWIRRDRGTVANVPLTLLPGCLRSTMCQWACSTWIAKVLNETETQGRAGNPGICTHPVCRCRKGSPTKLATLLCWVNY
jgi:hypothetical protein